MSVKRWTLAELEARLKELEREYQGRESECHELGNLRRLYLHLKAEATK